MMTVAIVVFIICISCLDAFRNGTSCGIDQSPVSTVYEGVATIETYPWMGMLYYPMGNKRLTTSVVLVTKQMVIAAASEIDKLPKQNFRATARVVLGRKCGGKNEIRIREYTYHPEFNKNSFSALAMVQLDVDNIKFELRPICPPPAHFIEPQFFAMAMSEGCKKPRIRLHRMQYVNIEKCKSFYRKSGLGQDSLWPTHTACARAVTGGRCLWRSGSVLAVKQDGRWRMVGFSVYGPGCGAPARFLDYGMYQRWVRASTAAIGTPAVSRIGDDHIVLRRSLSNVQRYGPCDPEEIKEELYTDRVAVLYKMGSYNAKYNVTLLANVEYSCVVFKARPLDLNDYKRLEIPPPKAGLPPVVNPKKPLIRLRRWCATPTGMCYGFQHLEIQFYVLINFSQNVEFKVLAYGQEAKVLAPNLAMKYANLEAKRPSIYTYKEILTQIKEQKNGHKDRWFFLEDIAAGRLNLRESSTNKTIR